MNDKNKKKVYVVTQSSLILRIFAGVYLLYLVYQMVNGWQQNSETMAMISIVASVIFAVVGMILIVQGVYFLITGRYAGGAMDISGSEKETLENNTVEENTDFESKETGRDTAGN